MLVEPLPAGVIIFGIGLVSVGMALLTLWFSLLAVLLINIAFKDRRTTFRGQICEWSLTFALLTVLGVASMMLQD